MQRAIKSMLSAEYGGQADSWFDNLLAADCVLPTQFGERRAARSSEQRLLMAVLEDAINCFFGDDSRARMEAAWWFRDRSCGSPFSFENVCAVLGFDSGWLRKGLFRQRSLLRVEEASGPVAAVRFSRAA